MAGPSGKLYSEKEIGAILKRTAELSKGQQRDESAGLTLAELETLAAEAGLDPTLVSRAAAELGTTRTDDRKLDFFGGPLKYSHSVDISAEVSEETWERMVARVRQHFGEPGVVSTRTGVREWTAGGKKKAQATLFKLEGGSRLDLFWSDVTSAIPVFLPTLYAAVLSPVFIFEEAALAGSDSPSTFRSWPCFSLPAGSACLDSNGARKKSWTRWFPIWSGWRIKTRRSIEQRPAPELQTESQHRPPPASRSRENDREF